MARRRESGREPERDDAPGTLPRDPFGRREPRSSARLDFLFDARRPDPKSGAVRPHPARREPSVPAPAGAPAVEEPSTFAEEPPIPAPAEPPADALIEAVAPSAIDLTPPPFEPPPPLPRETPSAAAPSAPGAAPSPRGFKQPGARYGAEAFLPGGIAEAIDVAACLALGVIAALFSRRTREA